MRRKIITVLAAVAILASLVAVPAGASIRRPIRGQMEHSLNMGYILKTGAAPEVSWYGTVAIRGATYPMVYYGDLLEDNNGWMYWEDRFEILASLSYEADENGVIVEFDPGDVILEAADVGWGGPSGAFVAVGSIVAADGSADPFGRLRRVAVGDVMFYRGSSGETGFDFAAAFRIFALR